MARPVIRTVQLSKEALARLHGVFGSMTVAYRNLGVRHELTLSVFERAWKGGTVAPSTVGVIDRGWRRFVKRLGRELATGGVANDAGPAEAPAPKRAAPFETMPKGISQDPLCPPEPLSAGEYE